MASTSRVRLNLEVVEDRAVPATLSGTVLYDSGGAGSPGSGVEVVLTRPDATTANTTTDATGVYAFTGLASGSYAVQFTAQGGYSVSSPSGGSTVVVIDSEDVTIGAVVSGSGSGSGSGSASGSGSDNGSGSGSSSGSGIGTGGGHGSTSTRGSSVTFDHYPAYLSANSQAFAAYQAGEAMACAAFDSAGAQADAAILAAYSQIYDEASAAAAGVIDAGTAATGQAVSVFLGDYDDADGTFDAAWADAESEDDFNESVTGYETEVGAASGQLVESLDDVSTDEQAGYAAIAAQITAATTAAKQAWLNAMTAALSTYTTTTEAAWAAYVATEQTAWDGYVAAQVELLQPRLVMTPLAAPEAGTVPTPHPDADPEDVLRLGAGTPISTNIPPAPPPPLSALPAVEVPNPFKQLLIDFIVARAKLAKNRAALVPLTEAYDLLARASVENHRDTLLDRPPAIRDAALRRQADYLAQMLALAHRIQSVYGQYLTSYIEANHAANRLYNEFPNLPIFETDPIGGYYNLPDHYLELLEEPEGPIA